MGMGCERSLCVRCHRATLVTLHVQDKANKDFYAPIFEGVLQWEKCMLTTITCPLLRLISPLLCCPCAARCKLRT